jgi:hypothetical protein
MQQKTTLDIFLHSLSLQLPSKLSESPLALTPLVPVSHASLKMCTQL